MTCRCHVMPGQCASCAAANRALHDELVAMVERLTEAWPLTSPEYRDAAALLAKAKAKP